MLNSTITSSKLFREPELERLLKKDIRFLLVFLLPAVPPVRHLDEVEDLATALLISKSEFRALRNSLLRHGQWELSPDGFIQVKKFHLDLGDLTIHEFTNMSLSFLTHISEDGPCNYENLFVVTTEEIKKQFYININRALKELIDQSKQVTGDRLLGWTHIGIDFGSFEKGLVTDMQPLERDEL